MPLKTKMLEEFQRQPLTVILGAGALIVAVITLLAPHFGGASVASDYTDAIIPLVILACAIIGSFLGMIVGSALGAAESMQAPIYNIFLFVSVIVGVCA